MTTAELLAAFDKSWAAYASQAATVAASGDQNAYYGFSYILNALVSVAEATKDPARMKVAVDLISTMIDKSVLIPTYNGQPQVGREWLPENQLYYFKVCQPIARAAAVISRTPGFTAYAGQGAAFAAFVKSGVIGYWIDTRYNGVIPWLSAANGGWGSYQLWQDRCSHLGSICSHLFRATSDTRCRDLASRIAKDFLTHTHAGVDGALTWDTTLSLTVWEKEYDPVSVSLGHQRACPDTSHSNGEALFCTFANEAGIPEIHEGIVKGLGKTLAYDLWDAPSQTVANYIDGGNQPFRATLEAGGVGAIYSGWVLTGLLLPEVNTIGETILSKILAGAHNPTLDYNGSNEGRLSLAAHLYRNKTMGAVTPVPPPTPTPTPIPTPTPVPPVVPKTYTLQVTSSGIKPRQVYKDGGSLNRINGGPLDHSVQIVLAVTKDTTLVPGGNLHVPSSGVTMAAGSFAMLFWDTQEWWLPMNWTK